MSNESVIQVLSVEYVCGAVGIGSVDVQIEGLVLLGGGGVREGIC